jgi:selenocysteine lyase/cysteine desulfurase
MTLTDIFIEGVKDLPGVVIYGAFDRISQKYAARLPIVSINIADMDSGELAENLWNGYNIAVRPGVHCAPLIHKTLGTEGRGTARFSFSWFNTEDEILAGVEAIRAYAFRERERHGG